MKNLSLSLLAATLLMAACNPTHTRTYSADDGSVTATCRWQGDDSSAAQWQFTGKDGKPLVQPCDSIAVSERGLDGHPMTVTFFQGNRQQWRQYYSTMLPRAEGTLVDGQREGRWVFYFANGNIQCESSYHQGRENGTYRVLRENGAPYYIGRYRDGQRTGTWEIYDEQGNLIGKQEYGD